MLKGSNSTMDNKPVPYTITMKMIWSQKTATDHIRQCRTFCLTDNTSNIVLLTAVQLVQSWQIRGGGAAYYRL